MNPQIRISLIAAGAMIGVSLGHAALEDAGVVDGIWSARIVGAVIGLTLAAISNRLPKYFDTMLCARCSDAQADAFRLFAAWGFTLAGIAYAMIWIFAPLEHAAYIAISVVGSVIVIVGARLLLSLRAGGTKRSVS